MGVALVGLEDYNPVVGVPATRVAPMSVHTRRVLERECPRPEDSHDLARVSDGMLLTAMKRTWGNGSRGATTVPTPSDDAGKSLTAAAPPRQAFTTSDAVAAPGISGAPEDRENSRSSSSVCGETRKVAPASSARLAASVSRIVPAPTVTSSARDLSLDISCRASGESAVSSNTRMPAPLTASATANTSSLGSRRKMAMTGHSVRPAGRAGRARGPAPGAR